MKKDPVCKMEVEETDAVTTEYDGETYYFCSTGCRDLFLDDKGSNPPDEPPDLIIIGGGPAGLTAAVYASTLKMNAFLITADLGGQAIDSTKIRNYMGYDFVTGPELIDKFKYQLIHSHYIKHLMCEVETIEAVDGGYRVTTADFKRYSARALIVATGMTRRRLNVPGEDEFQRKGLFYGNIQDFAFVHGKEVAVVGGGNSALQMVENLHGVASSIHLICDSRLTADPAIIENTSRFGNVRTHEGYKVVDFSGEASLSAIRIRKKGGEDIERLPVEGVFVAIGFRANSSLVSSFVKLNKRGEIMINHDCSSSRPGIFAAGDVTDAFGKRIIIASGEGAKAAMAARQYLSNMKRTAP
ncbi:MAG TPA: YHS domain-containing protein [Sedimenticola sp.]|nr:YHS domain-containing protein [Sedimenticola sp.]